METIKTSSAQADGIHALAFSMDFANIKKAMVEGRPYRLHLPSVAGTLIVLLVPGDPTHKQLGEAAAKSIVDHVRRGINQ